MIGKQLGGRYEIIDRVGGGGMAIVYKGHDLLLDRTVAIKVLRSQFGTDEDFIRRFRREAQAAAKLAHPNVVNIYDVGQEEETYYIVMEYVEGETLKDLIKREAPLTASHAVAIAIQIAEALDNAHQHQIIHRDIKPHNILLGKNGVVKVTDFGIARAVTSATITQTGSVLGSVHYFSPEQAKGTLTGEKSDIYSLGVVLYEMVTAELPFSGESPISVALKHLQDEFKDPKLINAALPQSVENVILRALSKDPEQRYRSAREMVLDLETCLSPARLNEPKFQPTIGDIGENPTIIIPAIREGDKIRFRTRRNKEEQSEEIWEDESQSKMRWIRPVVWLVVLALIIGIGFYFVKQIQSMLAVPEVVVPQLENLPIEQAQYKLDELGLKAELKPAYHDTVEKDYVFKQEPKEGTSLKSGTPVILNISLGKETVLVPEVRQKDIREAELSLKGFEVKIEYEYNEDVPVDLVIKQDPPAGESVVQKETIITLIVSKGGESFAMPPLLGMTLEQAKATLLRYGLDVDDKIIEKDSYFKKGLVISQWPVNPGEQVSKGTKITLEVSSGYKEDALHGVGYMEIIVETGREIDVEIRVSDARYNEQAVIKRTVRETETIPVEVVVSPERNAIITVYENGIESETLRITYDELLGGE